MQYFSAEKPVEDRQFVFSIFGGSFQGWEIISVLWPGKTFCWLQCTWYRFARVLAVWQWPGSSHPMKLHGVAEWSLGVWFMGGNLNAHALYFTACAKSRGNDWVIKQPFSLTLGVRARAWKLPPRDSFLPGCVWRTSCVRIATIGSISAGGLRLAVVQMIWFVKGWWKIKMS